VDDRFEPNDTAETPAPLSAGEHELVLCAADADWYRIPLVPLQALHVELEHEPGPTVELLVQPEGGRTLANARSAQGRAELRAEVAEEGVHLLQVVGDNAQRLPYGLRLRVEQVCSDDELEPNDSPEQARPLPEDPAQSMVLCPANEDWYALAVQEADLIQVVVSSPGDDVAELTLVAADGVTALREGTWDPDAETSTALHLAAEEATVYVRVRSAQERVYTVGAEINPAQACPADELERNDHPDDATFAAPGTYLGLVACRGDDDWVAPDVPLWGTLDVTVQSPTPEALGVYLVDVAAEEQRVLTQAVPGADGLTLSYRHADEAVVPMLLVTVVSGRQADYTLELATGLPPECTDDELEDNDRPEDAPWPPDEETPLSVCVDDPDWFVTSLLAGDRLQLDLAWDDPWAEVALDVLDAAGAEVLTSAEPGEQPRTLRLVWEAFVDAELLHRVTIAGTTAADYRLVMQLDTEEEPPPECEDDAHEDNDDAGQAVVPDPDPEEPLVLCPGDEDWYLIWVARGETVQVDLSGPAVDEAVLRCELYGAELPVATCEPSGDGLRLRHVAELEGDHLLRLFPAAAHAAGLSYDVDLSFELPEVCLDDELEDNDGPQTATPLEGSPEIVLCEGDDDWFEVFLAQGDRLLLQAAFTHADGNVDLVLHDEAGAQVAASAGEEDGEQLDFTAVEGGAYRLLVRLADGVRNTCTLTWELELPDPPECTIDDWEDNDDWEQATVLWAELSEELTVCFDDEDWYSLSMAEGDRITVRSLYDPALGRVALELYGPWAFPLLASSLPAEGVDQLQATAEVQDNHLLRAWVAEGDVLDYALEVLIEPVAVQ